MESTSVQLENLDTNRPQTTERHEFARSDTPDIGGTTPQSLKPVDGGIAAWKVLIAAFVFEALLWGEIQASIKTW
jgi:hypothetical protein